MKNFFVETGSFRHPSSAEAVAGPSAAKGLRGKPQQSAILPLCATKRRAFTLVEMLVALAVLVVLLVVMFVPLNMSSDLASIGTARANTQLAADQALDQITGDLQRAIVVFPNNHLAGVTTLPPYNANPGQNGYFFPYLRDAYGYAPPGANAPGAQNVNACRSGTDPNSNNPAQPALVASGNTARIDFLLPGSNFGALDARLRPENTLVSYYCRRRDISKPFDPIENPVTLFRAQMPYRIYQQQNNGAIVAAPFPAPDLAGAVNVRLTDDRFARRNSNCTPALARELKWMTQNQFGEFDLAPLCQTPPLNGNAPPTFASHSLVLPRDMAVIAPNATAAFTPTTSFVPDSTFLTRDTNGDGKIDVIEVQLNVGQYDKGYAVRRDQGTSGQAVPQPQVSRTLSATIQCINVQQQ